VRATGGLAVAAAVAAAGAGSVLAAVPAAAAAHGTPASSCTVRWTGRGHGRLWTDPENWSTRKVPGASDNVCIINPPINDTVLTPVSVTVHSLLLRAGGSIDLRGTAAEPVTFTVALTRGFRGVQGHDVRDDAGDVVRAARGVGRRDQLAGGLVGAAGPGEGVPDGLRGDHRGQAVGAE
jgi:hypothetical protein